MTVTQRCLIIVHNVAKTMRQRRSNVLYRMGMLYPSGQNRQKKQSESAFLLIRHSNYSAILSDCFFGDFTW